MLGGSLATVGVGWAIGIGLSVAVAQPLAIFLAEGVAPLEPATFLPVVLICLFEGGMASVIPARRPLSVDPIHTACGLR